MHRLEALSAGLGAEALALYPTAQFATVQQSYDQMSTDAIILCPTVAMATHFGNVMRSPVYQYVATVQPPFPLCFPGRTSRPVTCMQLTPCAFV